MAEEIPPPIVRFLRLTRVAALMSAGWAASGGLSPSGAGAQERVDPPDPGTVPETDAPEPLPLPAAPPTPPAAAAVQAAPAARAPVGTPPAPAPARSEPTVVPPPGFAATEYTVVPGDTLWTIARRLLGPSATPAEIAREVDHLWRLNADTIGTWSPRLIQDGVVLRLR